jgi:hypothetical protein
MVHIKAENKYSDLYVTIDGGVEKKKELLKVIKNVLVIQKEIERILKLKRIKTEIINDSKKVLLSMSEEIYNLNKSFPNVKNIISYTEKEIISLEKNVTFLKGAVNSDERAIKHVSCIINEMKQKEKTENKQVEKPIKVEEEKKKPVLKKKLTKIERIENNLKVIEEKLKGL